MDVDPRCASCGGPLPTDSPGGSCPTCLLRAGLGGESVAPGEGPLDASSRPWAASGWGTPGQGSTLDRLSKAVPGLPRVLLREADPAGSGIPVLRPDSPEVPPPAARPGRLQIFGEIARGGMGAVLRGRDVDLGRELAVKVLLECHEGHPEMVRRFVEEAQIAGQLQHPGVVPVYELGAFADRRPYFAMKLVKGRTLAELLAAREGPGHELPRFLGVFEQACQTIAYAHSRGVIHRDLKPSNVMVGAFGEVQVMDWGLAKVLPHGGASDDEDAGRIEQEAVISTARSGPGRDLDESRAGSVMGTPSYMAPEQAGGDVGAVDRRADVFGLGSILCEVLTGRPAYAGRTSHEVLRKAARGDTADALDRLGSGGFAPDLLGLARDCLALEPRDRPRDAGVVATRLAAHLSGVQERLRMAELAKAEATARAEQERTRRRLTLALAASLLGMVALGGGGWAWAWTQRDARRAETARAVDEAIDRSTTSRGQARAAAVGDMTKWAEALAAADQARAVLDAGEAGPSQRARVTALLADLGRARDAAKARADEAEEDRAMVGRLDAIRLRFYERFDDKETSADYAGAFREYGLDLEAPDPPAAAKRVADKAIRSRLVEAIGHWSLRSGVVSRPRPVAAASRLLEVARTADDDPWRSRLCDAVLRGDSVVLKEIAARPEASAQSPATVRFLAEVLTETGQDKAALALLRAAQAAHRGDFWVNLSLGYQLSRSSPRPLDEEVRALTAATAIDPQSPLALIYLSWALTNKGAHDEALVACRQAVALRPGAPEAHSLLGMAFWRKGQLDEAAAAFREVIRLEPRFPDSRARLREVLRMQGRPDDQIPGLREEYRASPRSAGVHYQLRVAEFRSDPREGERVRSDWERVLRGEPGIQDLWFGYPELCLYLKQEDAYRRARATLLDRFGPGAAPQPAQRIAIACLLLPADGDDLKRAVELAERGLAVDRADRYFGFCLFAKGLAEYRSGRYPSAIDWMKRAEAGIPQGQAEYRLGRFETATGWMKPRRAKFPSSGVGTPITLLVQAMAEHRSGLAEQARTTLATALTSFDWDERGVNGLQAWTAHVLRREAEGLIAPAPEDKPGGTPDGARKPEGQPPGNLR